MCWLHHARGDKTQSGGGQGRAYNNTAETPHASVTSRSRRIVLGLYQEATLMMAKKCLTHLRTVAAAVVDTVHAPPAIVFLHALQFQMPTAERFTLSYAESCSVRADAHVRKRRRAHLAAEGAGVACVLGDLHLRGRQPIVVQPNSQRNAPS
jgi:hypothetical protein